jgi:hypothetical protein
MFSWATSQFEKIAQTVAPPPTDPPGRLVLACKSQDEALAIQIVQENFTDPIHGIVSPKSQTPLHFACLYSMPQLFDTILMNNPTGSNAFLEVKDNEGNNALHFACMSQNPDSLPIVKKILEIVGKEQVPYYLNMRNGHGQTPYDAASLNSIRQFLLPIQLQAETQAALDNGGQGLPPGIDLGGLKITNSHLPPPPVIGGMPPPLASPGGITPQQSIPNPATYTTNTTNSSGMYPQPSYSMATGAQQQQPPAPQLKEQQTEIPPAAPKSADSTSREYARTGRSSAAIYKGRFQPDGFHSSSSDKNLQEKYGHVNVNANNVLPPPPSSGNSIGNPVMTMHSAPPSLNASLGHNPYAGGGFAARSNRYVAIDPVTGQQQPYGTSARTLNPLPTPPGVHNFVNFSQGISQQRPAQQTHYSGNLNNSGMSTQSAVMPMGGPASNVNTYSLPAQPVVEVSGMSSTTFVSPSAPAVNNNAMNATPSIMTGGPQTPGNSTSFRTQATPFSQPNSNSSGVSAANFFGGGSPAQSTAIAADSKLDATASANIYTSGSTAASVFGTSSPTKDIRKVADAPVFSTPNATTQSPSKDTPTASSVFGATPTMEPATTSASPSSNKVASNATASALFSTMPPAVSSPPAVTSTPETIAATPQSSSETDPSNTTAKALFGTPAPQVVGSPTPAAATSSAAPSSTQNEHDDDDEEHMDEIPLTPGDSTARVAVSGGSYPSNNLLAAIGMPPPPFSASRK